MSSLTKPPLKKTFEAVWYHQDVHVKSNLPLGKRDLFRQDTGTVTDLILPEGVKYTDLLAFTGLKTKITIEVIPW